MAQGAGYEFNNACQMQVMPALEEIRLDSLSDYNPHGTVSTAFTAGDIPEDFRALARERRVDFLLLWRFDARFATKYAAMLGLGAGDRGPVLLDLRAWREGASPLPRRILAASQDGEVPLR